VRLLTPFDWRWFYGDAVFIVDPWLWLVLGAGVWLARRRHAPNWSRDGLVIASIYIAAMLISARTARGIVDAAWTEMHGRHPRALMVGPRFLSPLTREVIVDAGGHYERGTFSWPSTVEWSGEPIPKNDERPEVAAARNDPDVRAFLVWSRFPFWTLEPAPGGTRVTVGDMRFVGGPGVAARNFTQSVVVSASPDS